MRIAIDPVTPFLTDEAATTAALDAFVEWLDDSGATTLLTWNGDPAATSDRRLERLLERAAVILRFHRVTATSFRAEIVRARHAIAGTTPVAFEIQPGLGVVPVQPELMRSGDVLPPAPPADLLIEQLAPLVHDAFRSDSERGQTPS
jgi:hypothetical protein